MSDQLTARDYHQQRRREFAELLAQVWLWFPRSGLCDALQINAYWTVLSAVPLPTLREVAQRIGERRPAPESVPSAPEWLEMANVVATEFALKQQEATGTLPTREDYHCTDCRDTGWRPTSERFVAVCGCRSTNPAYQRTRTGAPRYTIRRRRNATTTEIRDGRSRASGDE